MNKPLSNLLAFLALTGGALLMVGGATFVVIYFKDAIFMRPSETDRSVIFWYLPFLLAGIGGLVCGFAIGQAGLYRLRNGRSNATDKEKSHE